MIKEVWKGEQDLDVRQVLEQLGLSCRLAAEQLLRELADRGDSDTKKEEVPVKER